MLQLFSYWSLKQVESVAAILKTLDDFNQPILVFTGAGTGYTRQGFWLIKWKIAHSVNFGYFVSVEAAAMVVVVVVVVVVVMAVVVVVVVVVVVEVWMVVVLVVPVVVVVV